MKNSIKSTTMSKPLVIYPGRFQPWHSAHKETYDNIVDKFGKDNVYIVTSNKVEPPKSYFNFEEKKDIITTMFPDIPSDHIIQVKNPYQAIEIVSEFPRSTPVIFVLGNKDAERLSTKGFFDLYQDDIDLKGNDEKGYIYIAPENKTNMSGSYIRDVFASKDEVAKKKLFIDLYGDMNKKIYDLLANKIMIESMIMEGAAYGHIMHLYDIKSTTFADIREFIDVVLQGKMEYARIKTDGMNLLVSFINGQLRGARNKSDLKNFGKDSLTINGMSDKFKGRDGVQTAFVEAMRDLQHAFGVLPKEQLDKFFENGKKWLSIEVIHPDAQNIIPYNKYELRLQSIRIYDENGNVVGEDVQSVKKLDMLIDKMKQNKQDTYEIKPLEIAVLPKIPDFNSQKVYFNNKVDNIQSHYKLKDKNTIADVYRLEFEDVIKQHAKQLRYNIPNDVLNGLIERWAFDNKGFKIGDIKKIDNEMFVEWVLEFDKDEANKLAKEISNKFEYLTLEIGAVALKNLSTFMVVNPKKAVQEIKSNIDDVIKKVQQSNDVRLIDKMRYELGRLSAIGGTAAIAPEEGITFFFKGHFIKITGAFAPLNQIMNLKYKLK